MKVKKRILGIMLVALVVLLIVPLLTLTVFAEDTCTVKLLANDGLGTQKEVTVPAGKPYVLPQCEFTPPAEKTFLAWAIGSESGEHKQPGSAITVTEDIYIVAIWTDSAAIYETRPNGGVTTVNGTFDIRYRLNIQPELMYLEFYNDYQKKWATHYCPATMPESEGALTHFNVPTIYKNEEITIAFRLVACKDGIEYYSNTFAVKYTNNRFTEQPEDAMLSPGEAYDVSYAMNFTPTEVVAEYKDGGEWKHFSNAYDDHVSLYAGDGEKTIVYRIKAIENGDVYYSNEFKVRWCEITDVGTWGELLNAVNSDKTYIRLANSITDEVPDDELPTKHRLFFDGGLEYVLDLGPYMIYVRNTSNEFYTDNFSMIGVINDSKLTVKGGNIRFENYYADSRASKGVISVSDTSTLMVEESMVRNYQTGPVVFAEGDASVTINGGEYTVQNGFALHLIQRASLKLDDGVYVRTTVGDSAETTFSKGYGALYSESTGTLDIQSATFKSGVQVHESQIGAFDISTHEVVINGEQLTEDIFIGSFHEAKTENKAYYWYDFHMMALNKVGDYSIFSNTVRVIAYDKKSPITVENGTAFIDGVPVTEAAYGQTVTIVADPPEAGKEFVCWAVLGGGVDYAFSSTTTLTMAPNAMAITACYGNSAITSTDVTITPPEAGKTPTMTATASNHAEAVSFEWYIVGHGSKLPENEIFYPGFDYGVYVLIYPEEDYKFADTVAVTVNGENATVSSNTAGYVLLSYEFDALPANPFNVSYKPGYQPGVDGRIELNIDSMKSASAAFSEALDADKVSYQWYSDGVAIDGATGASYTFVSDDIGHYIYCVVTADEAVAYGYTVECTKELYNVYFNLSETVSGGRAPELTSATPGIAISASSYVICEKYSDIEFGNILDISQMILIPGKTYRVVANYVFTEPDVYVGSNATFYVNGNEAIKDGWRIIYDFTVPEADFDLNVTSEHTIGIGAELVADEIVDASYQWYRNGEPINGATSRTYIVTPADKVSLIHCNATKENGDYGCSSQYIISHYITVIRLNGPTPKNGMLVGEAKSSNFSANAANANIGWFIGTADNILNHNSDNSEFLDDNSYAFVEGTNYVLYVIFVAKDTYAIHPNAVAYYNGIEGEKSNSSVFLFDVVAIHTHVYGDTYNAYDEDGHWKRCTVPGCTAPDEEWEDTYMPHWSHTATCVTMGKCGECDFEYYGAHDIAVPNYVYIDDMKCGSFCATDGCDYLGEWSYHTGGTSDCQNKAICEICHTEYGKFGDHVAKDEWMSDGEYHWHECKNCDGQQLDKAVHTGGAATCTSVKMCEICNIAYGELDPENHTGVEEWTKTENTHIKKYSCCDLVTVPESGHNIVSGECTVCGYGCTHTSATKQIGKAPECELDGWKDYYKCDKCGDFFTDESCESKIADIEQWKIGDGKLGKISHAWGSWTSNGDDSHTRICTNNNNHTETNDCSGGEATCTERAACTVCGEKYGNTASHSYTTENGYKGEDGHANTCVCGAHDTPTAHTPDRQEPTEDDPKKCTVCGYIITPATGHISHTPKDEWQSDSTHHWHGCTGCEGQQLDKAEHNPQEDDGDCTTPVLCVDCGRVVIEAKTHAFTNDCDKDCNNLGCENTRTTAHIPAEDDGDCTTDILCTICGEIAVKGSDDHISGADDGDCTTEILCTVCGKVTVEAKDAHTPEADDGNCITAIKCTVCTTIITAAKGAHVDTDSNGKCDACGSAVEVLSPDPDPKEPKEGLSGGAIAGIVIGSVAVAGIGGFSIFWFVVKKNSFTELVNIFAGAFEKVKELLLKLVDKIKDKFSKK